MNNEERKKRLQIPTGRLRLVIDTDAKNEVDDQFAIAWALIQPQDSRPVLQIQELKKAFQSPYMHPSVFSLRMNFSSNATRPSPRS